MGGRPANWGAPSPPPPPPPHPNALNHLISASPPTMCPLPAASQVAVVLEPSTGDSFRKLLLLSLGAALAGGIGLLVMLFGAQAGPGPGRRLCLPCILKGQLGFCRAGCGGGALDERRLCDSCWRAAGRGHVVAGSCCAARRRPGGLHYHLSLCTDPCLPCSRGRQHLPVSNLPKVDWRLGGRIRRRAGCVGC